MTRQEKQARCNMQLGCADRFPLMSGMGMQYGRCHEATFAWQA